MSLDVVQGHVTIFLRVISPHFFMYPVVLTLKLILYALKIVDIQRILFLLGNHMIANCVTYPRPQIMAMATLTHGFGAPPCAIITWVRA